MKRHELKGITFLRSGCWRVIRWHCYCGRSGRSRMLWVLGEEAARFQGNERWKGHRDRKMRKGQ